MKKLLLTIILSLLLCAISVSAAEFNILQGNLQLNTTGAQEQTLSGSFTIDNTGTNYLSITFSDYTLFYGIEQLSISPLSSVELANGSAPLPVPFFVVVPKQKLSGLYTGTLKATSNLTDFGTIEIKVNVTPSYSVKTDPSSEMNLESVSLNHTYTKSFEITNTGNDEITNIDFGFSDIDFEFNADKNDFTLAFNETETIEFNITIPADYSTGNISSLGYVTIASTTELNRNLFNLKANVGGGLMVTDLDVFLTTREPKTDTLTDVVDGERLNFEDENIGPESELRFNFIIENTFTNQDDIDIRDMTVKVTIEEIDDGDDIEEESEEFDLDADTEIDVDVIVKIPLSVDEGNYNVVIEVLGEDKNENQHKAQMNLEMDIDKETHEVIISKASLSPEKVKCIGTSTLTATLKNLGKSEEDDIRIEIINSDLNINFAQGNILLEKEPFDGDDEYTKKLIINVDGDTKAGTYPITIKAYIQEGILWKTKRVNFVVDACSSQEQGEEQEPEEEPEEETAEETEPVEIIGETEEETTEGEAIPILKPETTTETSFTKTPLFWFLVIALNIIVVALIAFLVVKVIGKK